MFDHDCFECEAECDCGLPNGSCDLCSECTSEADYEADGHDVDEDDYDEGEW